MNFHIYSSLMVALLFSIFTTTKLAGQDICSERTVSYIQTCDDPTGIPFNILLPFNNIPSPKFKLQYGKFKELENGQATLSGTLINIEEAQLQFELSMVFSGRTNQQISSVAHDCLSGIDATTFYYYTSFNGQIIGINDLAGANANITNSGNVIQLGYGANWMDKEFAFGSASNFMVLLISNPLNGIELTRIGRGQSPITCQLGLKLTDCNPCALLGGDSDGDGICNDDDCAPDNPDLPTITGKTCDDGDATTINDTIQEDGCACKGTFDPCALLNGDSDEDGICDDEDCAPDNPDLPTTAGKTCDDGDATTINDTIQEDGCACKGTFDPCALLNGDSDGDGVCDDQDCAPDNPDLPTIAGKTCDDGDATTINDTIQEDGCACKGTFDPCALLNGDSDGDGVCDDEDCEKDNPNIPAAEGTPCDDGDDETVDDVILEGGCDCLGEISDDNSISVVECAVRTAFNTVRCMDDNYYETNYGGYILFQDLESHYSFVNGVFLEYPNGTARLKGEWINIADDKIRFEVDVSLSGRTITTPPNSPKGHHCLNPDESGYYYYLHTTGILLGKDKVAGAKLMVGRAGPAFQFGLGANVTNNELTFGGAGWLTITVIDQPTTGINLTLKTSTKGGNGDININLSGESTACIDRRSAIIMDCVEDITVNANAGQNEKVVTWETPTISSTCIFSNEIDCSGRASRIEGFEYIGAFNGSKYYCSSSNDFTYDQARSIPIQNAGHLAVICSQEENDYLKQNVAANTVWIGYFDAVKEGTFVWANGVSCGYTNWNNGEPNDGHSTREFEGADYTVLDINSGKWKDRNGLAQYKFIMEIPCTGTMAPGTKNMVQTEGLASGKTFPIGETTVVYEGKDDCGNIKTCSFKVTVKAPIDPCSNDNAPKVTLTTTAPDCTNENGKIIFKFADHPNRTNIEFSLDGGQTYPLNVKDNLGSATFDNLPEGNYNLFVRWGNNECPVDLGNIPLEIERLTPGTACNDRVTATTNDIIQEDGCSCEGTLAPCATKGGDTDEDGICDAEDCAPENEHLPAEPGTPCNDGNDNTVDDVILANGCNCQGTPISEDKCAVRTASNTTLCTGNYTGAEYGGYLLLEGLERHYSLVNGKFVEYTDGTANLTGTWINLSDDKIRFEVNVTLSGRTATTPPNSPKSNWCLETDESNFYYYTQTTGILMGQDKIAGAKLVIGRAGPAFQLGVGANPTNKDLSFGGAGWLTVVIEQQPTTSMSLILTTSAKGSNGDININLSGEPMACIDNRDGATANCLEDIITTADANTNSKIVNWEVPTFSSNCIYNSNIACDNAAKNIEGMTYIGELNGSRYYIANKSNYTYATARKIAIQNGGHLAVICNQTENDFLVDHLNAEVSWIGYSDEVNEGTFIWTNGANCDYTNWLGNDPNDAHNSDAFAGADHTVIQQSSGRWLDRNGKALYSFILEIPCAGTMPTGTAPMVQTKGPAPGKEFPTGETTVVYEGKDDCGNVATCTFKVTVKAPADDPCAGAHAPQAIISKEQPDCGKDNGQIIFTFTDHSSRTNIEFSLDGGNTYPLYVSDKAGSAIFDNLAEGDYDVYVRWGNNDCPVDLGKVSLKSDSKEPGKTCDDGDNKTTNDVIQSDGCSCQGIPVIDSDRDGIIDEADCAPDNPSLPTMPGSICDDGDANTERDIIQENGCDCQGTTIEVDPCATAGGDSDGDGICNAEDCQPDNPLYPLAPGTACDDNDEYTTNDQIQDDGCTCMGEEIDDGGCDDLLVNPSFEAYRLSPWIFNSNTKYNKSTRYRADGNYMVWIYKRYAHKKDASIHQDAVALPGAKYSFSFYAGTHRPDFNHKVAIEFYNAYGARLKQKAIQIDFDVDGGNILKQYHLEETAPSGTTKIRFKGTADGDYLKLDAICVQIDKSNVQASGRVTTDTEATENGLSLTDKDALYYAADAVSLGTQVKNEGIQLDWFSKNLHVASTFIIEKSLDGINFEQIDEVSEIDGEDLSILDEAPDYGTNYYRVIQQFENGKEIVSNIRAEKYMLDPASITLYPNPVADNLNVRIGHFSTVEGSIRIFSQVGQQVFEKRLLGEDKHISINVADFKNGMYFMIIEGKNRKPIERQFIVENLK